MQNKGIVIVTAVLLTLASIFYLSFSVATSYFDSEAAKIKDPIAQQDYKDSVKYLGVYSYKNCLETQIGLGLDLKGGMNVILEISVPDVIETLADHKTDAAFTKAMKDAKAEHMNSQGDFIKLFMMLIIVLLLVISWQRFLLRSRCRVRFLLRVLMLR
jgi:SecD/SecF fusion protein